jgi:hypothetical protein
MAREDHAMTHLRLRTESETAAEGFARTQPSPSVRLRLDRADDCCEGASHEALEAIDCVSRRINDLARQLNCLGYFDDDNPRPRAA